MATMSEIDKIMQAVLEEAEQVRLDAGYAGRHDDGGAEKLRTQVRFYQAGQRGGVPSEWRRFAKQIKREADPDWAEYQRLREKFADAE